jgi:hypothetical protein
MPAAELSSSSSSSVTFDSATGAATERQNTAPSPLPVRPLPCSYEVTGVRARTPQCTEDETADASPSTSAYASALDNPLTLLGLPEDALVLVLEVLDAKSLCSLRRTCRQLKAVAGSDVVWRNLFQARWRWRPPTWALAAVLPWSSPLAQTIEDPPQGGWRAAFAERFTQQRRPPTTYPRPEPQAEYHEEYDDADRDGEASGGAWAADTQLDSGAGAGAGTRAAPHSTVDASSAHSRQSTAMVETEAMVDGEKGGDAAATGCEP